MKWNKFEQGKLKFNQAYILLNECWINPIEVQWWLNLENFQSVVTIID